VAFVRLPLRGQRRWGLGPVGVAFLCFPFNCAEVKNGTCTNPEIVSSDGVPSEGALYNDAPATFWHPMSKIQDLADRVERLLLRHEELKRTNELLEQQVTQLTHERDNLRSRLNAARSRIDALLDRLPVDAPAGSPTEGDNA
jgi:cell division protein ZapB